MSDKELKEWYLECQEVSQWFFERTDVDCLDHRLLPSLKNCPWCAPYNEFEKTFKQAKADLRRNDE